MGKYHCLTPPMSFIKVGRSKDATLNTSGSAVQMTGVEPHNTTEDRHVHPYFLYSANGNYSDSAFVLQDTYVKICHNNFQSSRWKERCVHQSWLHCGKDVKAGVLFQGSSFVKMCRQLRPMAVNYAKPHLRYFKADLKEISFAMSNVTVQAATANWTEDIWCVTMELVTAKASSQFSPLYFVNHTYDIWMKSDGYLPSRKL